MTLESLQKGSERFSPTFSPKDICMFISALMFSICPLSLNIRTLFSTIVVNILFYSLP